MCGKPCRGQGTQGRGRNQRPATSAPRPTTPFIPNRHPGLVPHPICPHSPICTQPTGTPRCPAPTRHPGLVPPSDLPTFAKTHRGTYQPNEPNRPSHIRPTTNHTLHTQQAPRPRPPSDLPAFAKLHATHGYATLPSPHQTPRPRIRTTHALKTQTTSPKTPHIHSISPKWSALWAHTVQLEARRRRHNGCAYDLHHCGARTLHHRCK